MKAMVKILTKLENHVGLIFDQLSNVCFQTSVWDGSLKIHPIDRPEDKDVANIWKLFVKGWYPLLIRVCALLRGWYNYAASNTIPTNCIFREAWKRI